MNTKNILIAALLASAFAPVLAADLVADLAAAPDQDGERRIVIRQGVPAGQLGGLRAGDSASVTGAMVRISSQGVVKNAPYSGEAVTERLQQLSDGNQIVNKSSALQYRDSAGRTRTEVRDDDGRVRTVTISNPVDGARWVLSPEHKTATRIDITSELARADAAKAHAAAMQARVAATQARADADGARNAAEQARAAADQARTRVEVLRSDGKLPEGTRVIVKEIQRSGEAQGVQVRVAQSVAVALPAARALTAQIAPLIVGASNDGKWSSKAVTRDLGTREFGGLKASGQQRSYTIPANEIGNRNPIEVSSETWTSPELQVLVYFKHSDPRSGELVYRLENLKRTEPNAALFSVPSGYTVRDPLKVFSSAASGKAN